MEYVSSRSMPTKFLPKISVLVQFVSRTSLSMSDKHSYTAKVALKSGTQKLPLSLVCTSLVLCLVAGGMLCKPTSFLSQQQKRCSWLHPFQCIPYIVKPAKHAPELSRLGFEGPGQCLSAEPLRQNRVLHKSDHL